MLIQIKEYSAIDRRKLMDLYSEGNIENANDLFPDMQDRQLAVDKVETDFLDFLKNGFFSRVGSAYWVLEEGGIWISALRLNFIDERTYYLEALETHPAYRKMGYATKLLNGVIDSLKKEGSFRICDCVNRKNTPSIKTHEKCGFRIASDPGYDYLSEEYRDWVLGMEYSY